jgi:dihydroorotase
LIADLLLKDGQVYLNGRVEEATISILNGKIVGVNSPNPKTKSTISIKGLTVLPGAIDSQVHFRDPGMTHKEDFGTGTRSALKGGITTVFDMPNTLPPTTSESAYMEKLNLIRPKAWTNFGLFAGAIKGNTGILHTLETLPGCVGIKIFMGKSTGGLLLSSEEDLEKALANGHSMVAVHCEDEDILEANKKLIPANATAAYHPTWRNVESALTATKRIVKVAKKTGRKVHVLHITTKEELDFLKNQKDIATVEVLPQHMFFYAPDCYEKFGSLVQMNPPIREKEHSDAIWAAVKNGWVDVMGSDHAPHTMEEKEKKYPESPSGIPGVQTMLPLLLNWVSEGRISLSRLVQLISQNPAKIYKLKGKGRIAPGYDADLTLVDLNCSRTITNEWIESKAGWSPYDGLKIKGWPISALINGHRSLWDEEIVGEPKGTPVEVES